MSIAAVAQLVIYPVSERDIEATRAKFAGLDADTREGYEEVRQAIAQLRSTRTSIEKRRVELKADALDYGRRVDRMAKKLTDLVADIEEPLKAKRDAVDAERERQKREIEKAEMLALEAKLRADREVEEARLREEATRQAAVQAEQRAAQAKLDAERRALDEQRLALEAQQREVARAEAERQQLARIEAAEKERVERERVAAEEAKVQAAAALARLEELRPDVEKIRAWAGEIRAFASRAPVLDDDEAAGAIGWSIARLEFVAKALEAFKKEIPPNEEGLQ